MDRLEQFLQSPRLPLAAVLAAAVLTLPSISDRLVFDDYVLGAHVLERAVPGLAPGPMSDLFAFTSGRVDANRALAGHGALLPWWSDFRHLNTFFRPLSSLTHRVDFRLFPHSAAAMHAHSWLWFLATLFAAHRFFAATAGAGAVAGLSVALFAIDDAHGATLSWISNRNALVALTFAMLAVASHLRMVRGGPRSLAIIGPACFGLGLAGGESAISALGYLVASALTIEADAWRLRLLRLLPYGLLLVGWRVVYRSYGLGSFASGGYHDPIREPVAFLGSLAQNLPILLASELGIPYADQAFWGSESVASALVALSIVIISGILTAAWPLLRRSPIARFYLLGATLAAIPVSASVPGQRLLFGISFGVAGLLAMLLLELCKVPKRSPAQTAALLALGLIHLPGSAAALPLTARSMTMLGELVDSAGSGLPTADDVTDKTVVIVNAPVTVLASYEQLKRAYWQRPRPAHLYWLATASSALTVTRQSPSVLHIRPDAGFMSSAPDRHYRRDMSALSAGESVRLPGLSVTVQSVTDDGRPQAAVFDFGKPLASPDLALFEFRDGRYVPWSPPAVGHTVRFPKLDLFELMAQHVLSPPMP